MIHVLAAHSALDPATIAARFVKIARPRPHAQFLTGIEPPGMG
jgi:hypothetical protein